MVSKFRIPSEAFDHFFGLKENFPKQYEMVLGKKEDAKLVQEENDPRRNVELCKNLLYSTKQMIEQAIDLIKGALIDIEDRKFELGDMLDKLTQNE